MMQGFIVIPTQSLKRNPSKQTIMEQEELNIRIKLNKERYDLVSNFLNRICGGKLHLKEAVSLATSLSQVIGCKLDRKAKRYKPGIICWFCENWERVFPLLLKMKGIDLFPKHYTPLIAPMMYVPPQPKEIVQPAVSQPINNINENMCDFNFFQWTDDQSFSD